MLGWFGIDIRKEEGREKLRKVSRASLNTGVLLMGIALVISYLAPVNSLTFNLSMTLAMIGVPFILFSAYANSVLRRVVNVRNS